GLRPAAPAGVIDARPAAVATVAAVGDPATAPIAGVAARPSPARWILFAIAAGVPARLLWLGVGLMRLRRLRADSRPAALDDDLAVLRRAIEPACDNRWHDAIDQPVTFGARRPVILLPARMRRLPTALQRAALYSELLPA